MKSDCLLTLAAVLLSSQSIVAEPEHDGHGGNGGHGGHHSGHGGGFGFHRGHGGFHGGRLAPPMYPYPPPIVPVPAPVPVAPAVGVPAVGVSTVGVPAVGVSGVAARYSMPNYPWLDGMNGIGPMFDDSVSYDFGDSYMWGKNRNLAAAQAGQAGAVTAQASANVQVGSAGVPQPQMGFVAQGPAHVGQVTSSRFNIASNFGATAGQSARMLNQGTDGLQIQVDGQGAMEPSQGQVPPPPPPPQPPLQQPVPMPPQPQGGLVTKGFVRKSESFQEQKSGSKQSSKEFEKTTTPI